MTTFEQIRDRLRLAVVYGMFLTDEERSHLDREIDEVLESIAKSGTVDSGDSKWQELELMQAVLATICFKYKIDLSERQDRLVREYDRCDLLEVRTAAFHAIKRGQFP